MSPTTSKPSSPQEKETFSSGQSAAQQGQAARAERAKRQPLAATVKQAVLEAAGHGKFGPTRIGGPSA